MGNVQEKGVPIDPDLELLETKQMGNLFEFCVYQNQQKNKRLLFARTKYSINQQEQNHNQINQLLKLNELPHAIKLIGYEVTKQKHFCHVQNQLILQFEIPSRNLNDFQKQISILKDLTESTLWLIIDDLIDFLLDLQIYGMNHGDLWPEYIYLTEMKSVVVCSPLIYTQFKNGYFAQINSEDYCSILSPEQLSFYIHRCWNVKIDYQKVDIFQIGVSILCLLSSWGFQEYYDYQKGEFFSQKAYLDLCNGIKQYQLSEEIKNFIQNCIKESPQERWSLDQMSKFSKS